MERFEIEGGRPLTGTITPIGNKNAALPLLASTLLTAEPVCLRNVPDIGDVRTMVQLLRDVGAEVIRERDGAIVVRAADIRSTALRPELCARIRASLLLAGPLLARVGSFALPPPGGDVIGRRRNDTHWLAFTALGAEVQNTSLGYDVSAGRLVGADVLLDEASVMATENAIMAATLAEGSTVIRNAASEPHVQDLCRALEAMGAQIEGIGSNLVRVHGVSHLGGAEYTVSPDYIEIGSFIGLGAVTEGELRIGPVEHGQLRMIRHVFDRLGVGIETDGDHIRVSDGQKMLIREDDHGRIPRIHEMPWPGFPTDLMSIALVTATQAIGTVLFQQWMFESRLYFVDKLIEMGARIVLADPHRAVITGPARLRGQRLESPDIRAGMALLIAALCADGRSSIGNIGQIDRGYERIEEKLRSLGAAIERVPA